MEKAPGGEGRKGGTRGRMTHDWGGIGAREGRDGDYLYPMADACFSGGPSVQYGKKKQWRWAAPWALCGPRHGGVARMRWRRVPPIVWAVKGEPIVWIKEGW